jgi:hypothetical protein
MALSISRPRTFRGLPDWVLDKFLLMPGADQSD